MHCLWNRWSPEWPLLSSRKIYCGESKVSYSKIKMLHANFGMAWGCIIKIRVHVFSSPSFTYWLSYTDSKQMFPVKPYPHKEINYTYHITCASLSSQRLSTLVFSTLEILRSWILPSGHLLKDFQSFRLHLSKSLTSKIILILTTRQTFHGTSFCNNIVYLTLNHFQGVNVSLRCGIGETLIYPKRNEDQKPIW